MIVKYILKIYLNPKSEIKGFTILTDKDWHKECESERSLDALTGCSSMSSHDSKQEAIDHARKSIPVHLFNKCF